MIKEIGIYSDPKPSHKEKLSSCWSLITYGVTIFIFGFSVAYLYKISSSAASPVVDDVKAATVQEKDNATVQTIYPQTIRPIQEKRMSDGSIEEYVTLGIITSPFVWDYVMDDMITSDKVSFSVSLSITSQVLPGYARKLLQNYGGNWFYTVFIPGFKPFVKSFIQSRCNEDAMYKLSHDEKTDSVLTAAATAQIKRLSQKIFLPVVIKQVKVVSVYKK